MNQTWKSTRVVCQWFFAQSEVTRQSRELFSLESIIDINNPSGTNQVLPVRAREDLGEMAMKEYSTFSKAPALLEPHHQIV